MRDDAEVYVQYLEEADSWARPILELTEAAKNIKPSLKFEAVACGIASLLLAEISYRLEVRQDIYNEYKKQKAPKGPKVVPIK